MPFWYKLIPGSSRLPAPQKLIFLRPVKNGATRKLQNDVTTLLNWISNRKPTTEYSGILNLLENISRGDQTNASYKDAEENVPNTNFHGQMKIRLQNSHGIETPSI